MKQTIKILKFQTKKTIALRTAIKITLSSLLFVIFFAFNGFSQLPVIEIGQKLPEIQTKFKCATTNKTNSISDFNSTNGLLLIFSCNTCPFVVAWEDRYPLVHKIATDNKIGMVLINSNHAKRDGADSFEAMKEHATGNNYKWPYILDNESEVANSIGAQTTPHVFLFDKNMKLVYKGAIDDNYKDASMVKDFYLKNALENLALGKEIHPKETKNIGCGIKRKQ